MKRWCFLLGLLIACNPLEDPIDAECVEDTPPPGASVRLGLIDEEDGFQEIASGDALPLLSSSGGKRIVQLTLQWLSPDEREWGHRLIFREPNRKVGERELIQPSCEGWTQLRDVALALEDQRVVQAVLQVESGPSDDGETFTVTASTSYSVSFR